MILNSDIKTGHFWFCPPFLQPLPSQCKFGKPEEKCFFVPRTPRDVVSPGFSGFKTTTSFITAVVSCFRKLHVVHHLVMQVTDVATQTIRMTPLASTHSVVIHAIYADYAAGWAGDWSRWSQQGETRGSMSSGKIQMTHYSPFLLCMSHIQIKFRNIRMNNWYCNVFTYI